MVSDITYEDIYVDDDYGTTTLYFIAPKERLKDYLPDENFPEAVSMEISIEVPTDHIEAKYANVSVSPTKEVDGGYSDYDWHNIDLDYVIIETLFMLADV